MNKHRAIPQGYMTVGDVAKKMNVTVRTMQYYDKVGLLPPSRESEGGLRLYTHKEIVQLRQILSMKRLGFSLDEIKAWLPAQNTPQEVSSILVEQAEALRKKIHAMTSMLESIEKLNAQVLQTKSVDWETYGEIFDFLQANSELYWMVKHLPHDTGYVDINDESTQAALQRQNHLLELARDFQRKGISPESEQGQKFAKEFWDVTLELTNGDTDVLSDFADVAMEHGDSHWQASQDFIGHALSAYFAKNEINISIGDAQ